MQFYKLDDKTMDSAFLRGEVVKCRAVVSIDALKKEPLEAGTVIVVMLSNGKKYKGSICSFQYVVVNDYAMGELDVVRR